ncbi:RraA family protein [Roseomonas sp. NAR14]|uniref:Putative 4-hydroxy-4-methyl-2-oxoglutarate aldolase n=1 Tax=Roseomonas acroporae TaxID=2937791 RepID=A0A9X2BYX1_9PROT|nr:RraA family protein [Roseomonas acroporae]MCK8787424.1 RraA family protein [Roseomonas acroporae]
MTLGFRIRPITTRVPAALCARAAKVPAANLGDVVNRIQTMRGGFRPYGGHAVVAGPAFTVRARPGDNLMLHRAIDLAEPGDVIVCDGGHDLSIALMGELMIGHAAKRGVAGIVLDGAVRDIDALAKMPIGVWACGVTPSGPYKDGPGEIGTPTACGGQVVMPGDLILADTDGVVVIPREDAEAAVAAGEAHNAKEVRNQAEIEAGAWARDWVAASLRAKGCEGA